MQKHAMKYGALASVHSRGLNVQWLAVSAVVCAFAGGCDDGDGITTGGDPSGGRGGGGATGGNTAGTIGTTGGTTVNTGGAPGTPNAPSDVLPSGSQSFSPTGPQSTLGLPNKMFWIYRTAEGKPVRQLVDGVVLNYIFDDLHVEVDQQLKTKTTTLKAQLQGTSGGVPVTGSVSHTAVEHLVFAANTTAVADTNVAMRIVMKADTETVTIDSKMDVKAAEPMLWFPDRSDLGDLAVGHEHRQADVALSLKGKVTASVDGEQESEDVDLTSVASEVWVVKEKLDGLVVLGRRYKEVVKLLRKGTSIVDGETTKTEATMWVAHGVGVIRFESFVDGIDKPVLHELLSTNVGTL